LIVDGVRRAQSGGGRVKDVEIVLDEIAATAAGIKRANAGDLVVLCVDRARAVWDQLQIIGNFAQAGAGDEFVDG